MNNQAISKLWREPTGALAVHHIFRSIQGEGPFAGRPAVFVRLAGCVLACPMCDTDYTSESFGFLDAEDLYDMIEEERSSDDIVVFTGGEPLRQNIVPVIHLLQEVGIQVQIETNGTLFLPELFQLQETPTIVCSPKTVVHRNLIPRIEVWKYVLGADDVDNRDGLPLTVLGNTTRPARPPERLLRREPWRVYVQPLDSGNKRVNESNIRAAIDSCLEHGYRLSLQIHKLIGLE